MNPNACPESCVSWQIGCPFSVRASGSLPLHRSETPEAGGARFLVPVSVNPSACPESGVSLRIGRRSSFAGKRELAPPSATDAAGVEGHDSSCPRR